MFNIDFEPLKHLLISCWRMRDKSPVLTVGGDWLPVGDESPKLGSPVGDGDGGGDWLTPWAGGGRRLHTPAGLKH